MFTSESRVFLPESTVHRASQLSLSECLSLKIPNSALSVAKADIKSKNHTSQADITRSPQWMIGLRGQRGPLSRQNAVSQSSTPDSTPRLLSPVDSQAFTSTTLGGLLPCSSRALSPRSSICWLQGSQDEPSVNRSELPKPFIASTSHHSPFSCNKKQKYQLQRSSSGVSAWIDLNKLWKDSGVCPQTGLASTSRPFLGPHLSRSKSHPCSPNHHDMEDINIFNQCIRHAHNDTLSANDFNQISCCRLHQSVERSDSLVMEKNILNKACNTGSSTSQDEEGTSSCHKQQNLSVMNSSSQSSHDYLLMCSDCSASETKLEVDQSNDGNSHILNGHKMTNEALCSVNINSNGHSRSTNTQASPIGVYESLLDGQMSEESDKFSLLTTYTKSDNKNSDEMNFQRQAQAPTADKKFLCRPTSPIALPVRPDFLSLTERSLSPSATTTKSVTLSAEAATVALQQKKNLTPLTLTVAPLASQDQKSSATFGASSSPMSVDGHNVLPSNMPRQRAQIGRMHAISSSDEFLESDKL